MKSIKPGATRAFLLDNASGFETSCVDVGKLLVKAPPFRKKYVYWKLSQEQFGTRWGIVVSTEVSVCRYR
jgi:hypothetical protein